MHETRPRGPRGSSASAVGVRHDELLDDWLGEISDDDWSENAAELAQRRRATPAYERLPSPERDVRDEPRVAVAPADTRVDPAEARRQVVERRRLVAGLVLLGIVGIAVLIPVLLLRGGNDTPQTAVTQPAVTPTAPSETSPSPTQTGPAQSGTSTPSGTATTPSTSGTTPSTSGTTPSTSGTTPSTSGTTPSTSGTTPSTSGASGFSLPEGTKLALGEGDPALVSQLQQALTSAGYEPGSVDGSFGKQTEAAVTAFQQDNGLTADGVVGAETAAALNNALSSG